MTIRRLFTGHLRFFLAILVAALAYVAAGDRFSPAVRNVVAWDAGAFVYVASLVAMFARVPPHAMTANAEAKSEGEWTIFWVTLGTVVFSFTAVLHALTGTSHLPKDVVGARVGLVAVTLLLSWSLTQIVFAMRYAHEYYERKADGSLQAGLQFPGENEPDYWDFLYFALSFGMAFQTSDTAITSRPLRRLATVHGFIGFLFNTVIVALTVNLAASLA